MSKASHRFLLAFIAVLVAALAMVVMNPASYSGGNPDPAPSPRQMAP